MIAYKFLRPGAVGPFSHRRWPLPGDGVPGPWLQAAGGAAPCRSAVHGCAVAHLPWWIQEELWEAELGEPVGSVGHKLTAPRGRLLRRVDAWDDATARAFSRACARAAADHAAAALDACGATAAAAALRGTVATEAVPALAARLPVPEQARIAVTMAADAAVRAAGGHTATAAYIAAHAARQAAGDAGMAAERERQAAWLAAALGLAAGGEAGR